MHNRKQIRRYNTPCHAHALTFSCYRRQPFLAKDRFRGWVAEAVSLACSKHRFELWAYVFMPDHDHMVVNPTDADYDVSKFLATLKNSSSKRAMAWVRGNAPDKMEVFADQQPSGRLAFRVWQRGPGFDLNLICEETVRTQIDYIHANPVRKGLCARSREWWWSSALDYEGRTDGPITVTFPRF